MGLNRHSSFEQDDRMNGTILSEIRQLTSLKTFALLNVSMDGMLPTQMGSLTSLVNLLVPDNNITGPIPGELGCLTKLAALKVNMSRQHRSLGLSEQVNSSGV